MHMAGRGPAPATGRAPARAGRHPDELDLAEFSATFPAQPVAIAGEHDFALTPGRSRTAPALRHPGSRPGGPERTPKITGITTFYRAPTQP